MKCFLPILLWLWPYFGIAQAKEVSYFSSPANKAVQINDTVVKTPLRQAQAGKPEIFTSGFIDIVSNGQVNASARFIRLYIGEPGNLPDGKAGFAIPVSFYGGVSNNTFQNTTPGTVLNKSNMHLVNEYINPLSGLINVSIEGVQFFTKKNVATKPGLLYQIGERVLTGIRTGEITNPLTGKPTNFLNSFGAIGLYFQTGAWERNNSKDVGVFWLALRYHACKSNPGQLKEFLPAIETNGFYTGWSAGFGIEITKLVNIKAIYYKYTKAPEIDYGLPIYQFSFNYSMR